MGTGLIGPLLDDPSKSPTTTTPSTSTPPSPSPSVVAAPIPITGESAILIKDSYNALLAASKQFQFDVMKAKYDLSIPKGYEINLATFTFDPPKAAQPTQPTQSVPPK